MKDINEEEAEEVVDAEDGEGVQGGRFVDHRADQQRVVNKGKDGPVGDEFWILLQDYQISPAVVDIYPFFLPFTIYIYTVLWKPT